MCDPVLRSPGRAQDLPRQEGISYGATYCFIAQPGLSLARILSGMKGVRMKEKIVVILVE
jgi:hypothetical protein